MPGDLPSSPAARAFFAALDGGAKSDQKSPSSSSFVQKRIQTLGWRNRFSQEEFYPVTIQDVEITVRQVQRGEVDGTYGTGATVWPAAVVLIKYLEKHAEKLLKNKRCVDLGSGTGVTSIAAALLGAKEVVCTDGEPNVVKLAQDNLDKALRELVERGIPVEHNNQDETHKMIRNCPLFVEKYWWASGTISGGNHADVVLVADCVLPKLYPIGPLVDAIDELLTTQDAVAILSYEYRYFPEFDPATEFRRLCSMKGLTVESVPLSEQDPVYSIEDIEIWHVYRT